MVTRRCRTSLVRFSLACLCNLFGCYGPFVAQVHVDKTSAQALESEVRIYKPADLTGVNYTTLGETEAISCKNQLWDPSPTEGDAISQLRFKAFTRHANGLLLWGCESYGTELSKNCWSSLTCRATMIYLDMPPTY
ncbi:Rcs stress response system protein RcsF [Candidatus Binatus sp.]|uniref:Rcs stress response system protein RcsF n=1 Tax=Candidatus Binatus sp. TaxID=2811406 RepID=UPI00351D761A